MSKLSAAFRLAPLVALVLACGGEDLLLPGSGEPAAIVVVSGAPQSGRVGTALGEPVVARVTDSQGRPVADAPVSLVILDAGTEATVAPATAMTGSDGQASFEVTLGNRIGPVGAELRTPTAGGARVLSAPVELTGVSADANELVIVSGDGQTARVGAALAEPLVVQVTDGFGNPIAGVTVEWAAEEGGSVSEATTVTGSDGLASVGRVLGPNAGAQHTIASVPGLVGSPITFGHTALAGSAAVLEMISGSGQSALVGTSLPDPLIVRARDEAGNPVPGLAVAWVVGSGGGSLAPPTSVTDGDGLASATWTLGSAPGSNTATAVISGVGTVPFTATANPGAPPSLALAPAPPATAVRGVTLSPAPVVQLREPDGTPRQQGGVTVTVSLTGPGGALRGTRSRVTGGDGRASFSDLAIEGPAGSYVLAFASSQYVGVSAPIALQRAPTSMRILSDDPDPSALGAAIVVRYSVESPGGTPVGSVRVSSDDGASCTATVAAGACSVTPTTAGARTLTAVFSGSTEFADSRATASHTVSAPPPPPPPPPPPASPSATRSTVDVANPTISFGGRTDVTVTVRDENGAPLEGSVVTLTASGAGPVTPSQQTSGKNGVARFSFSGSAIGSFTLTAQAGTVTLAARPTVTVTPAASQTRIVSDAPDPSEPGAEVVVHFTVTSAAGQPTGDVTVSASAGGSCTATVAVGSCALALGSAGTVTLTATYAGDATFAPSTDTESHTVAAPSLGLRSQPDRVKSGEPFKHQPEVQLLSASGTELKLAGVVVRVSLASGPGVLVGTTSATTDDNGRAKFRDLALVGLPGDYVLRFEADGFLPVDSRTIDLRLR